MRTALAAALLTVVALVGAAAGAGSPAAAVAGEPAPTALERAVAGLPQHGPWLGDRDAPVAIELFADLQSGRCASFAATTLPRVVRRWVADGTARIRLRFATALGRDSVRTARFAIAAGREGMLWQTAARLLADRGATASGYATDDWLRAVGGTVAGLDADATLAAALADATVDPLRSARRRAHRLGVEQTPALAIGPAGRPLRRFDGAPDRLRQLAAAIAAARVT